MSSILPDSGAPASAQTPSTQTSATTPEPAPAPFTPVPGVTAGFVPPTPVPIPDLNSIPTTRIDPPLDIDRGLTDIQKSLLLAHLVRCPEVANLCYGRLREDMFDYFDNRAFLACYRIAILHKQRYGSLPSRCQFEADMEVMFRDEFCGPDTTEPARDLFHYVYDTVREDDLNPAIGIDLAELHMKHRAVTHLGSQLRFADVRRGEHVEIVQEINETLSNSVLSNSFDGVIINVMDLTTPEARVVDPPRLRTGFEVLDQVLGGGMKPGEFIGVLGSVGSGKTAFAIQAGVSVARTGINVLHLTYETPAVPQLRDRVWAHLAETSIGNISRNAPVEGCAINPQYLQRVAAATASVATTHRIVDMTGKRVNGKTYGFGGVREVRDLVEGMITTGWRPGLVVIDWLGRLATLYRAEYSEKFKSKVVNQWEVINTAMNDLRDLSNQHGCAILITQQVSTDAGSSPRHTPSEYDVDGSKKFPHLLDSCLIIDKPLRREDGITRLHQPKGRNHGQEMIWVRYLSEESRFANLAGQNYTYGVNEQNERCWRPVDQADVV